MLPGEASGITHLPARWAIGPPAPASLTLFVRILWVAVLVLMVLWLKGRYNNGFDTNVDDPDKVFNLHPLMMTLGFPVLMSEALLVYRGWPWSMASRPTLKWVHGFLLSLVVCVVFAWKAVFFYHNSKGIDNLYSVHSYLGIATTALFGIQWFIGMASFGWPGLPVVHRMALVPIHEALGLGVYFSALATMLVGVQEKTTFIQFAHKVTHKYEKQMILPAVIAVLVVLLGLTVGYHFAPTADSRFRKGKDQEPLLRADDGL